MSRIVIASGAALVLLALAWAALLAWRLSAPGTQADSVVVHFNWTLALGAVGLLLASAGVLARMRRKRRPRM